MRRPYELRRYQLSLRGLLGVFFAVGICVAFAYDWTHLGARFALERLFQIVLISTIAISYCTSPVRGASRIFRTTLITGFLWGVSILSVHLMFAETMEMYNVSRSKLLWRACLVSAIGTTIAFAAAFSLQLIEFLFRYVASLSIRRRLGLGLAVAFVISTAVACWYAIHIRQWQPMVLSDRETVELAPPAIRKLKTESNLLGKLFTSPDGRFLVNLNGPLRVFDVNTGQIVANFKPDSDEWFSSAAFFPDSRGLVAVIASENGDSLLISWSSDDWEEQTSPDIRSLLHQTTPKQLFPILVEQCLLVACVDTERSGQANIQFFLVDLSQSEWTATLFASLNMATSRLNTQAFRNTWSKWMLSPDGQCIILGEEVLAGNSRWLITKQSKSPIQLVDSPLGFLPTGHQLLVRESSWRPVWSIPLPDADQPPFWHHLGTISQYRLLVLDCINGNQIAKSGWWNGHSPIYESSRSRVVADYGRGSLVWSTDALPR